MVWATALVLAAGANFDLVCEGGAATRVASEVTTATVTGTYGSAIGTAVESEPAYILFAVQIRIAGENGDITLPDGSTMKLKKIIITDDAITAQYNASLFDRRRFRIDRGTGQIVTSGSFQGVCRPRTELPKKF